MNFSCFNKYFITPPNFLKRISNDLIWEMKTSKKKIWLTFDDGPLPDLNFEIINILNRYSINATFFLEGKKVEKFPQVVKEIKKNGNLIGNHTYSHLNGWTSSTNKYIEDVEKARQVINSSLFRPPYGRITPMQVKILKRKFQIIMWSIMPFDFDKKISEKDFKNNIISNVKSGSVIALHCNLKSQKKIKNNIEEVIESLLSMGYEFCTTW